MKRGSPFGAAHGSFPQGEGERARWLARYAAFAVAAGVDPQQAKAARSAVETNVSMLDPEQDRAILYDAGFSDVEQFFAAFTWRGWIAYA
jgi:tRNA (cmo5U34)-methyltransferase